MIKFRRGSTKNWRSNKTILESGQPGFDKDKNKIKVGDGKTLWSELPYASGLQADDIIDSEVNAKSRLTDDKYDKVPITFGTPAPDKDTVGQLYLQQNSNADYIIESGTNSGWFYQIYASGLMKCSGKFTVETSVIDGIENTGLFCSNGSFSRAYPKTFKNTPIEIASLQGANGISWLAATGMNTISSTGSYTIISPTSQSSIYTISISAEGIIK